MSDWFGGLEVPCSRDEETRKYFGDFRLQPTAKEINHVNYTITIFSPDISRYSTLHSYTAVSFLSLNDAFFYSVGPFFE